jgi:hypothetical protein
MWQHTPDHPVKSRLYVGPVRWPRSCGPETGNRVAPWQFFQSIKNPEAWSLALDSCSAGNLRSSAFQWGMTLIGFNKVEISMKKSPAGPPYVKCTGPAGDFFTCFSFGAVGRWLVIICYQTCLGSGCWVGRQSTEGVVYVFNARRATEVSVCTEFLL